MKLKKLACMALGLSLSLSLFAGCGETKPTPPGPGPEDQTEMKVEFTQLWAEGATKTFAEGETYTLDLDVNVGGDNYLKFDLETQCGLDATMNFVSATDESQTYSERFFVGKGQTEFRQILDYYHTNKFEKVLKTIDFKCVQGSGEFKLNAVSIARHPINFASVNFFDSHIESTEECMRLFIHGDTVKLGINLKLGGAIDYLSSVNEGVGLHLASDNTVSVGASANGGSTLYADDINLINRFDTGRLIQQSFYGTKGDSIPNPKDDYQCSTFEHDGNPDTPPIAWPYNPVQGGDQHQNLSQLIDVQYTATKVQIKARPMDWAKNGSITPFYMEDTYEILKDDAYGEYVQVINKSTDFSGYVHNNVRDQELPAFYGITPLGTLATYKGFNPWSDSMTIDYDPNLDFWSPGTVGNRFRATENWIAWVNEEKWGVGLYVPDVESMLVGRAAYSVDLSYVGDIPSASMCCTYTAPLGSFSMPTYDSFTYTYYLKLDYVESSRDFFLSLHNAGASNPDILKLEGRA